MPLFGNFFKLLTIVLISMFAKVEAQYHFENCTKPNLDADVHYKFNVWILLPYETKYKFSVKRILPAINMSLVDATEEISLSGNISNILKKSEILVIPEDTQCDADWAPNIATDIHDVSLLEENCTVSNSTIRDIDVVIGMTCDYASGRVASLANHWNWPVIFPGSRTTSFYQKVNNPSCSTMTRTGVTSTDLGIFLVELFKRYEWNRSMCIYTGANSHGAYLNHDISTDCQTMFSGVTTLFRAENWTRYEYYEYISRNTDKLIEDDAEKILEEIRVYARVSLWCVGRRTMRRIMQVAHKLNMTSGNFAFVYLDLYNTNTSYLWDDTDSDDHMTSDTGNSFYPEDEMSQTLTDEALRALHVVTLHTPSTGIYQNFSDSMKKFYKENYNGEVVEYGQYVNPFVTFYYDAMRMFIYGVFKSFCAGLNTFDNGEMFAEKLWGTRFESLGRNVTISENGDQIMNYVVMDMDVVTKRFEVILTYDGSTKIFNKSGEIDWPGKNAPVNIPMCNYDGSLCSTPVKPNNTIYYVLGVCAIILLIACVIMTMLFRNMQKERRLRMMMWRVKWENVEWPERRRTSTVGSRDSSHSISSSFGMGHNINDRQIFATVGVYKNNLVAVKEIRRKKVSLDRAMLIELEEIYALDHDHLCKFMGACDEAPHVCILTEYCSRGSLPDILEDTNEYEMDDFFKNSIISDIVKGMLYLHRSFFHLHGNLKSTNCLVDSRFVVKLTDFGLEKFRENPKSESVTGFKYYENKLWTAPELLRNPLANKTQEGDVYSFGIIVQEIVYRKSVFYVQEIITPQEKLHLITSPPPNMLPLRPTLDDDDDTIVNPHLRKMVRKCWSEQPNERSNFKEIQREIQKFHREKNLVDSLLERLEQYSHNLEDKVEERTLLCKTEKERADSLLYQMLPKMVAERLKKGNNVFPEAFESVTIFFSDIVGFTAISHGSSPMDVVNMLNDLYTMFDNVIDKFDVYKVETIGDAYMVVSGLPHKNENNHAREIARMSLSLLDHVKNEFKIRHMPDTQLKLRVGIHTGPVVAGVVGLKMPRYCLFGDTVNTASRMESNGKESAIHVSPVTKSILDEFGTFILQERQEEVFLKGLGNWKTWWLNGEITNTSSLTSECYATEVAKSTENLEIVSPMEQPGVKQGARRICNAPASERTKETNHTKQADKKGRRSGVKTASIALELTDELFLTPKEKRKRHIHQTLKEVEKRENESKFDMPVQASHKVHFHHPPTNAHSEETTQLYVNYNRKTGRDSGIELGFDNALYCEDLETSDVHETDTL